MPLKNLPFRPGIYSDETDRDVGKMSHWKDADKVRFFEGMPTKIGGWEKRIQTQFEGICRGAVDWRTYTNLIQYAFGTNSRLYLVSSGVTYDITPSPWGSGGLTFDTTNGSPIVAITFPSDISAVIYAGDLLYIQDAPTVGGITPTGYYTVTSVTPTVTVNITHTSNATSTATVAGGTCVAYLTIDPGLVDSFGGEGFGMGLYGEDEYGTPRQALMAPEEARVWSLDQWGDYLVANPRGGGIFIYESFRVLGETRASLIAQAPITARYVFVSPEDRHMIALGAHDGGNDNPMLVRWCDQENYTDWTPSITNTAGSKQLDMGNELLCAAKIRGEHLLFTDSSLYSMQFVGPPDTFAFKTLGDNGGLLSPLAVCVFEGVAYWMGETDFFAYDGVTKVIPCTVNNHVFESLNYTQRIKICAGVNRKFREIWWFYPSASALENDSYVIFNLKDQSWSYGTMARTSMIGDSDIIREVIAFGPDGYIYDHETGLSADGAAINAYITSGDIELDADGGTLMHMGKFVPDVRNLEGSLSLTVTAKKYPQAVATQTSGPHTITSTTQYINPRVRGRQVSLKFESTGTSDDWQLGLLRADITPHGGR